MLLAANLFLIISNNFVANNDNTTVNIPPMNQAAITAAIFVPVIHYLPLLTPPPNRTAAHISSQTHLAYKDNVPLLAPL